MDEKLLDYYCVNGESYEVKKLLNKIKWKSDIRGDGHLVDSYSGEYLNPMRHRFPLGYEAKEQDEDDDDFEIYCDDREFGIALDTIYIYPSKFSATCYKMVMDHLGKPFRPNYRDIIGFAYSLRTDKMREYVFDLIDMKNIDMVKLIRRLIEIERQDIINVIAENGYIDSYVSAYLLNFFQGKLTKKTRYCLTVSLALSNKSKRDYYIRSNPEWDYCLVNGGVLINKYKGNDYFVKVPDEIDGKKVVDVTWDTFGVGVRGKYYGIHSNNKRVLRSLYQYDELSLYTALDKVSEVYYGLSVHILDVGVTDDKFVWVYDGDGARIKQCPTDVAELHIPNTINGYKVKIIEDNACRDSMVQKLYIPDNVEEIGAFAFKSSKYLEEVYFYGKNKNIDFYAFSLVDDDEFKVKYVQVAKGQKDKVDIYSYNKYPEEISIEEGYKTNHYKELSSQYWTKILHLPDSFTVIDGVLRDTFANLRRLEKVYWPNSISTINLKETPFMAKGVRIYIGEGTTTVIGDKNSDVIIVQREGANVEYIDFPEDKVKIENWKYPRA